MIKLTGRIMPKRLFGKVRIDYGPYNGTLQSKIVEPSTEDQNVVADNGYNALSLVLVKAATLQEKTVAPSSQEQTIVPDVGVYGLSKVIVEPQGDHGLLEEITVTPTQEEQKITPSKGYYGIDVVNVEAAPLEEITIYPAYETKTIRPSEGYYGIGSIIVEAMDDPGSGGGGGSVPGGGGSGDDSGDEPVIPPSAGDVSFGFEMVDGEEEVPSGYLINPDVIGTGMERFKSYPVVYQYQCLICKDGVIDLYQTELPMLRKDGTYSIVHNAAGNYVKYYYTFIGETWVPLESSVSDNPFNLPSICDWIWMSHGTYLQTAGTPYDRAGTPFTVETEPAKVEKPVEVEEEYTVSGESMNDLVSLAQKITGSTKPLTIEEATQVLDEYYANPAEGGKW